jgi:hypothetical protein
VPYKIKSVHLLVIKVIITKMHGATHIKVINGEGKVMESGLFGYTAEDRT